MKVARGNKEITSLIQGLAATPDRLEAVTRGATDADLDSAAEGEWSARTVLAHLRDDEYMTMRLRLERMAVEDHPTLAPFDEKAWAASRWRGRDGLAELLADFRLQRDATMMVLNRLEGDEWRRTGLQPEFGAFDIHGWVQHWLDHDEIHIGQISDALTRAKGQ